MTKNSRCRLPDRVCEWSGAIGVLVWPAIALLVAAALLWAVSRTVPAHADSSSRVCGTLDPGSDAMVVRPCEVQAQPHQPQPHQPQSRPPNYLPACHPDIDEIERQLGSRWGEFKTANGLQSDGRIVQVYTSENGTFTIVTVTVAPQGLACIVSSGDRWRFFGSPLTAPEPAEHGLISPPRGGGLPVVAEGASAVPRAAAAIPGSTPGPRTRPSGDMP